MQHTHYSVTNKKLTIQTFVAEATSEVIYAFYVTVTVISLMNGQAEHYQFEDTYYFCDDIHPVFLVLVTRSW